MIDRDQGVGPELRTLVGQAQLLTRPASGRDNERHGAKLRDTGLRWPWGCAVKKKMLVLALTVTCALALAFGLPGTVLAEGEAPADAWQVRTIPTPVSGTIPSFISIDSGRIAWTGASSAASGPISRMFVFNLATGNNATIPVTLPGSYFNPCAEGPWVAFQGARTGASDDIYLYDTANSSVRQITYNAASGDYNDWNPRIDGNRLVWEKDMRGSAAKPGIYLYDIDSDTISLLIAGDEYRDPDISGDYVVCVKSAPASGATGAEVVLFNMVTKEIRTIASGAKNNEHPRIDSGKVVWTSGDIWTAGAPEPWPTYQISLYDIATGSTAVLTNNVAGNFNPSIENGIVAWATKQPSAIMAYDLATMATSTVSQQGDTVSSPEVDGHSIAWYGAKGIYYAILSSEATRFPDVPADHPYYAAIEGMAIQEVIEGYDNGNFGPSDLVTRQQFAKMIVLTMGYTVTESDVYTFADSSAIVHTAGELYPYHYVAKAALTGLTEGYDDGTFRPLNKITRQQVITMIVRAGSQMLQPPPPSYKGVLAHGDPTHGLNVRLAEYNGLLTGIVGPSGSLTGWDTTANATRGEVAQMLWNLLDKFVSRQ